VKQACRSPRMANADRAVGRIPFWGTALTTALLILGFRPQRLANPGAQPGEERFDADRGRFATTPSEIPARGSPSLSGAPMLGRAAWPRSITSLLGQQRRA